jgi:hypothetical protein
MDRSLRRGAAGSVALDSGRRAGTQLRDAKMGATTGQTALRPIGVLPLLHIAFPVIALVQV